MEHSITHMSTSPAYSDAADYKAKVIAMTSSERSPSSFPQVLGADVAPATNVLAYHSICLGAVDLPASIAFYAKLGFAIVDDECTRTFSPGAVRLRSTSTGFVIDLVQAASDAPAPAGVEAALSAAAAASPDAPPPAMPKNVLMDVPGWKAPGHTHASWSVSSVPAMRAFLDEHSIAISGTRSTLALFARDVDKTTLEFERNDGQDDAAAFSGASSIGAGKKLDHVGVRIRAPYERHIEFWARTMGFNAIVNKYETNVEPLKNFAPWITRTAAGCDINFIPNCNSEVPAAGEAAENALYEGGMVRAGILYVAYDIAEDAMTAVAALRAAGADAVLESEVAEAWPAFVASTVLPHADAATTVLLKDLNGTIVRLVPSTGSK